MSMPHMSGMEMLEALRQTDCRAPVIFMTASGSEYVAVQAFRLGVADYLPKPFDYDAVYQVVNKTLREQRLAREKETLSKTVAAAATVRQTVATLSHHINNQITVIDGGLTLLQEQLEAQNDSSHVMSSEIIRDCRHSARRIVHVLDILQNITKVDLTTYHTNEHILDIDTTPESSQRS